MKSSDEFKNSQYGLHYKNILCLKETNEKVRKDTLTKTFKVMEKYIHNNLEEIIQHNQSKLCVLPKNHIGKCCSNPIKDIFLKNKTTDKIIGKINLSIMSTPGADDYVFKNRASRLFPIFLTNSQEKMIKNKNTKLKCAIPVKEFTTPFCMATAYLDWLVYILNIKDIEKMFKKSSKFLMFYTQSHCLKHHKSFLNKFFTTKNRFVFNNHGYTICSIKRTVINVKDIADSERDNRIQVEPNDIQMGHLIPRCENEITIRGLNLSMMTRDGNRIIGENVLFQDDWIRLLKDIVAPYY